jgi:hypothetical protein
MWKRNKSISKFLRQKQKQRINKGLIMKCQLIPQPLLLGREGELRTGSPSLFEERGLGGEL